MVMNEQYGNENHQEIDKNINRTNQRIQKLIPIFGRVKMQKAFNERCCITDYSFGTR